jgi:signal transduction histidine kinase
MTRALRVRIAIACLAAASVASVVIGWVMFERDQPSDASRSFPVLLSGVTFALVASAIARHRRQPDDIEPVTLIVMAGALTASYFRLVSPPLVATFGAMVWFAAPTMPVVLAHVMCGRRPTRTMALLTSVVIPVIAAVLVVSSGPRVRSEAADTVRATTWVELRSLPSGDVEAVRQTNPMAWWPEPWLVRGAWLTWACCIIAIVVGLVAAVRRDRGLRDASSVTVATAATFGSLVNIILAWPQRSDTLNATGIVTSGWALGLIAVPMLATSVLAARRLWTELIDPRRTRVVGGAVEIDRGLSPDESVQRLRRTIGDPSARLCFPTADGGSTTWIDEHGRPTMVVPTDERATTLIERDGRVVAAIEYDALSAQRPDLVDAAAIAVGFDLETRALAARAERAADEAQESARRLLVAADDARRDFGHRIERGPERRLADLARLAEQRPLPLDDIHEETRATVAEIRSIARTGLPASLDRLGLAAAIEDLADESSSPIRLVSCPSDRLDPATEATLYLAVADAAVDAEQPLTIEVVFDEHRAVLALSPTGRPPAAELVDRIAALGGSITSVDGTTNVAMPLPIAAGRDPS